MRTRQSLSKYLVACSLALAVASGASAFGAQAATEGTAVTKIVRGTVKYANPSGPWMPLTKETVLKPGATVQTGVDAYADLALNGGTAVVRVMPGSTVSVEKLVNISSEDSETSLNVQVGSIIGNVKKLSKASHFDIRTPNGVAGIRGTEFAVTVKALDGGKFEVTFSCVQGLVVVATVGAPGQPVVTKVLNDNQSYTVGGEVVAMTPALVQYYVDELSKIALSFAGGSRPAGPVNGNVIDIASPVVTGR